MYLQRGSAVCMTLLHALFCDMMPWQLGFSVMAWTYSGSTVPSRAGWWV